MMRELVMLCLLLPLWASAQFPPPFIRNPFTTNQVPVDGVVSNLVNRGTTTNRNIVVMEGTSGATGLIVNTNQLVVSGFWGGVGINTNTPFQDLHVVGGVLIDSGDGTNFFQISGNQIDFQGGSKNVIRFPAEFEMEIQAPTIRTIGTNYVNGGLHVTNKNVAGVPLTVNSLASQNTNLLEVLTNGVRVLTVSSNGALAVLSDQDAVTLLGRTRIDSRASDRMFLSHIDQSGIGGFSIMQFASGQTAINSASGQTIQFDIGATAQWEVDASGDLIATADNTELIGLVGANRPAGINVGTMGITNAGRYALSGSVTWSSGSGSPEGVVTAVVGSLYSRTDGGAGTSLYVKESGSGNTGWVGK